MLVDYEELPPGRPLIFRMDGVSGGGQGKWERPFLFMPENLRTRRTCGLIASSTESIINLTLNNLNHTTQNNVQPGHPLHGQSSNTQNYPQRQHAGVRLTAKQLGSPVAA